MTTIKEHCCGADLFFNKKTANKKYRSYLKKGPSRVTKKIIEQLEAQNIQDKSMVDVGGGIGALQWWFLENGGNSTTDIDASSGYLKQAEQHAQSKGWEDRSKFLMGDCVDLYPKIDHADFITLDKVVCCYPNYKEILEATCDKTSKVISLSYPMDGFFSIILRNIGVVIFSFMNNPFRPFIHKVKDIRTVIEHKGYKRVAHTLAFPWHVETYTKQ